MATLELCCFRRLLWRQVVSNNPVGGDNNTRYMLLTRRMSCSYCSQLRRYDGKPRLHAHAESGANLAQTMALKPQPGARVRVFLFH